MPEGTASTDEGQYEDGPLTLRIQRMNADRLTITVDSPQVYSRVPMIGPPQSSPSHTPIMTMCVGGC